MANTLSRMEHGGLIVTVPLVIATGSSLTVAAITHRSDPAVRAPTLLALSSFAALVAATVRQPTAPASGPGSSRPPRRMSASSAAQIPVRIRFSVRPRSVSWWWTR